MALAKNEWDRDAAYLLMFAEPDLFGESADWEGGEEEWAAERGDDDDEEEDEDDEMVDAVT